ncbi:hypothetical protein ACN47E_001077 [Coniothyrium glycines]
MNRPAGSSQATPSEKPGSISTRMSCPRQVVTPSPPRRGITHIMTARRLSGKSITLPYVAMRSFCVTTPNRVPPRSSRREPERYPPHPIPYSQSQFCRSFGQTS